MFPRFEKILARLPLFSALRFADAKAHGKAVTEFLYFWVVSTLPILFALLITTLIPTGSGGYLGVNTALRNILKPAEIFIFVNTLVAPVIFVMYKYNRDNLRFENFLGILVTAVLVIVTSAIVYALKGHIPPDNKALVYAAAILYGLAVLLRYLALVYDNLRSDYPEKKRKGENELMVKLDSFKGT